MKKNLLYLFLFAFSFAPFSSFAQVQEATLLGQWSDDENIDITNAFNSRYNEIWGVATNNSEVAIIGSTMGTHFIDVTNPSNPTQIDLIPGKINGPAIVHRDYHDYNGYLYAVCDELASSLQIMDLSNLPNSVEVVYDSDEFIVQSHNIFIDEENARLYAVAGLSNSSNFRLVILSLENPTQPVLLASHTSSNSNLTGNHDIFVRDNIAYINGSNAGFFVYDCTNPQNLVELGSMTTYPQEGYNHSGWLDDSGDYYYLMDETHDKDVKVVDVSDFGDMTVVNTFNAGSTSGTSIPHNCIVLGEKLYASYYYEGLQIYDISDRVNPVRIYEYDTYSGPDDDFFAGAWGVYPFLPSGNILVSDLQGGLFVIEESTSTNVDNAKVFTDFKIFPQPSSKEINLSFIAVDSNEAEFILQDLNGKTLAVLGKDIIQLGENNFSFNLGDNISSGLYFLNVRGESWNKTSKLIVQK